MWALIVPEALAYAGIAGVPPQYGLYAIPLAVLGYAIFGTSGQLFVGPQFDRGGALGVDGRPVRRRASPRDSRCRITPARTFRIGGGLLKTSP